MPVADRFRRLRRVGLHEAAIAVRQIEGEEVQLPRHPADHRPRLAEVHLGMARRMHQRHEHLSRADTPLPDVVLHYADRVKTLGGEGFRAAHGDVRIRHETHSWH